ncbi:MAG TPA: alkaline phosphatase family protein [Microlunatus sp.]|nr:alkaline phosphatase family protein [Microlunatus sp.]
MARWVDGTLGGDGYPVSAAQVQQSLTAGGGKRQEGVMARVVDHVVVFTQENHTTDNYFTSMRAWGANVATGWPAQPNPPLHDQAHTRAAYAKWLDDQRAARPWPTHTQLDTDTVLPYYSWLAKTGAFCENHCSGFGTNSTPNHLLIVGGQTPTLRNPPRNQPDPVWDMPSLPGHAADHGLSWKVYTGTSGYPVDFYTQLKGSPNIVASDDIVTDATNHALPDLSMVWHDPPYDEHPLADVSQGQDKVWQAVDAIITAGMWNTTVFLLSWDDWGGFDDHAVTPNLEHTADGVQLAYGPRVPLLIFGGPVQNVIDSRWNGHTSIGKTVLDLLGLPPLGVPRLDDAPSLADLIDPTAVTAATPPRYGITIAQPVAPDPTPIPAPFPPPPIPASAPVSPVLLRDGTTLPPPNDQPIPT